MKNREVVERILAYHPQFLEDYAGCDGYKYGNPEAECMKIAAALVPSVEVIQKAAQLGCNLLIVHEPTFYVSPDYPEWRCDYRNKIYDEKCRLLDAYGITIWRDHDHMHAHRPDSIFTGVIKYLGWEPYQVKSTGNSVFTYIFDLPETTVESLNKELKEKLRLNGIRYVGNPKGIISRVAIVGHLNPNAFGIDGAEENGYYRDYGTDVIQLMEDGVDAVIPGEVIEWTVLSYVRDAMQLGKNKAVFNTGHFSIEELGMKYAAEWIEELTEHKIPVHYIPSGDIYRFD